MMLSIFLCGKLLSVYHLWWRMFTSLYILKLGCFHMFLFFFFWSSLCILHPIIFLDWDLKTYILVCSFKKNCICSVFNCLNILKIADLKSSSSKSNFWVSTGTVYIDCFVFFSMQAILFFLCLPYSFFLKIEIFRCYYVAISKIFPKGLLLLLSMLVVVCLVIFSELIL